MKIEAIKFFGKEERILEQRGWVIENRAGTIPNMYPGRLFEDTHIFRRLCDRPR